MPRQSKKSKQKMRNIIAIGDAHGDYYSFAAVLINAGLINPDLKWTGGRSILVQMGDILDRGPDPLFIDNLLDNLQLQARRAGGDIIRLVGNHELEVLRKNYFITSLPYFQIEPFRAKLAQAILKGKWQASFAARGYLFTHAGVCGDLFKEMKKEFPKNKKITPALFSKHINKVFAHAVEDNFWRHPIFDVSLSRGGSDPYGGIFWEDWRSLITDYKDSPFKQIVGHTVMGEIQSTPDNQIIIIDVGMGRVFEGEFEYLKIDGKKPKICKVK